MQAANDVEFGGAFANALFRTLIDFFQSVGVGTGRVRIAAKGAEFAVRHANVGRIDVAINVEIGDVAVFFFADVVGEPADGQQIGRAIEVDAVFEREAFVGEDFARDGLQSFIGENQFAQESALS